MGTAHGGARPHYSPTIRPPAALLVFQRRLQKTEDDARVASLTAASAGGVSRDILAGSAPGSRAAQGCWWTRPPRGRCAGAADCTRRTCSRGVRDRPVWGEAASTGGLSSQRGSQPSRRVLLTAVPLLRASFTGYAPRGRAGQNAEHAGLGPPPFGVSLGVPEAPPRTCSRSRPVTCRSQGVRSRKTQADTSGVKPPCATRPAGSLR